MGFRHKTKLKQNFLKCPSYVSYPSPEGGWEQPQQQFQKKPKKVGAGARLSSDKKSPSNNPGLPCVHLHQAAVEEGGQGRHGQEGHQGPMGVRPPGLAPLLSWGLHLEPTSRESCRKEGTPGESRARRGSGSSQLPSQVHGWSVWSERVSEDACLTSP